MTISRATYSVRERRARGSVAVELAVLLWALSLLLSGMFVFGNILLQYNVLKNASKEAASYMAASGEWGTFVDGPARKAAVEAMTRRLANESGRSAGTFSVTTTCLPDPGCDDPTFESIKVELGVLQEDPFGVWRLNPKRFSIISTVGNPNTAAPGTP
jgi:hypothetical protein